MSSLDRRWLIWFFVWGALGALIMFFAGCTATLPLGADARFGTIELSYWPPVRVENPEIWTLQDK